MSISGDEHVVGGRGEGMEEDTMVCEEDAQQVDGGVEVKTQGKMTS